MAQKRKLMIRTYILVDQINITIHEINVTTNETGISIFQLHTI